MSTAKLTRSQSKVNKVSAELEEYPMEELARIRRELVKQGKPVFDFGTGDPKIPTWEPIRQACVNALAPISQYPSVRGIDALRTAQLGYLERRFGLRKDVSGNDFDLIPTGGSKEAIFHIALCLVGRAGGRKHIIYPDPGYPVYRSSTLFAQGIPYPVKLSAENGFLLEPWNLPPFVQRDAAAIWINYPHNPTGATATREYWEKVVEWCHKTDTILLSDDCYVDIYDSAIDRQPVGHGSDERPFCPLQLASDRVLSFMSLSKRSGMTGYRAGFVAGDSEIIKVFLRARANFGVGAPDFVQQAAVVAWDDDEHVLKRREIFTARIAQAAPVFQQLGLLGDAPNATFYLWTKIPRAFGSGDVRFSLGLAEHGVICSPSSWLSESIKGYARFALVPDQPQIAEALQIIKDYVNS